MPLVLPPCAQGFIALLCRNLKGGDANAALNFLRDWIAAAENLFAHNRRGFTRLGKRHIMRRTQTKIAPSSLELHPQHPRPRAAVFDKQIEAAAISMASRSKILDFQSRKRHGSIPGCRSLICSHIMCGNG
jgi:hypothetical protein